MDPGYTRFGLCIRFSVRKKTVVTFFFSQESLWTTQLGAFVKINLLELGYKKEIATICINSLQTMGDKSVETLCNKIEFLSILVTFPPFPPKQCWFFYFFDCTERSAYTTLNWGAGGIGELTLEANKIEQMLKYRKASFPKSVSTAFVTHCLEAIYANCGDFLFISKL